MALNLNYEVETKPGAGHRELASHFYGRAKGKDVLAGIRESARRYYAADKLAMEAEELRWKGHGHRVLGVIEVVASKVGWQLKL